MTKDGLLKNSMHKWRDIPNDGTLDNFAHLNYLNSQSLRLKKPGVIILPNNTILADMPKEKNLFTQTTKNVLEAFQSGEVEAQLYDDNRDKDELILDSADVILPILLFLGNRVASVGLRILANWIYDRWIKNEAKRPPSLRIEYAELDMKENIVRWRKIEGPVIEVQHLLSEESKALQKEDSKKTDNPMGSY